MVATQGLSSICLSYLCRWLYIKFYISWFFENPLPLTFSIHHKHCFLLEQVGQVQEFNLESICRCKMQFLQVKYQCESCILHLLWYFHLVRLVSYIANNFLRPSVFHAQRFSVSFASRMSCIYIHHIFDLVLWVQLTILVGPVNLLLL